LTLALLLGVVAAEQLPFEDPENLLRIRVKPGRQDDI